MDETERKKAIEMMRELRQSGDGSNAESKLTWMYKGPNDTVDREAYLLGKAIDKTFESQNNGDNSDIMGRSYEPSNVPKRLLSKPESTEQVDIAKKILEDPLYAIKQKELEVRRKLLDNPVKLKEIKKMIMEKNIERLKRKQEKKMKKKKDALKDEKKLDKMILKKLTMLSESQRLKLLEEAAEYSDSSSESDKKKVKKKKARKKNRKKEESSESRSQSESESESEDSDSRDKRNKSEKISGCRKQSQNIKNLSKNRHEEKYKHKKDYRQGRVTYRHKRDRNDRGRSKSSSSSSTTLHSSSSDSSSVESGDENKKSRKNKNNDEKERTLRKKKPRVDKSLYKKSEKRSDEGSRRRQHSDSSSESEKKYQRKRVRREFDHKARDRSKTENYTNREGIRNSNRDRPKVVELSEKEREMKLKEMMDNAKIRKEDREKDLARHRKKQLEEEKLKDYDDNFMRRQISHATSQGTMADRIRSNMNNIQRSKADMEKSFVRK